MNSIGKSFRRKTMVIVLSVFFISLLAVSVSYSSYSNIGAVIDDYVVEGNPITMTFKDDNLIKNTLKVIKDDKGLESVGKTFSLINNSDKNILYHVVLVNNGNDYNKENIKVSIDGEEAVLLSDLEIKDDKVILTSGILNKSNEVNDIVTHNLKIWAINNDEAVNFKIDVLSSAAFNVASDVIKKLNISNVQTSENGLLEDAFGNIRYFGNDPNNYVHFNNELWRIIGLFNVQNADGRIETKIKMIKNESIMSDSLISGTNYSWYENVGLILNSYLIGTMNNHNINIISNGNYYRGDLSNYNNFKATDFYSNEINAEGARITSKIGLLNISDYYYAMADGANSNWLNNGTDYWLLNSSNDLNTAFYINGNGELAEDVVFSIHEIKPVIYLKSTVLFAKGDGSLNNPYVIE